MVFKIILEEENTSISYTEEENISQTTQRISVFYTDFLTKARTKILEPKRVENLEFVSEEVRLDSNTLRQSFVFDLHCFLRF